MSEQPGQPEQSGQSGPSGPSEGGEVAAEARVAVLVGLAVLCAGPVVGVVWYLLAPLPRLRVDGGAVYVDQLDAESAVAADGWFAGCAATAGLVCALLVFGRIRRARIGALAGLVLGGLAGAVLAWRVGVLLGPGDPKEAAARLRDGATLQAPLELSAKGVLFTWPMASVIAYFALAAGLEPAPAREGAAARGRRFPVTVLRPGYPIGDVDRWFDRAGAGQGQVPPERFRQVGFGRRYDQAAVDAAVSAYLSTSAGTDGAGAETTRPFPG